MNREELEKRILEARYNLVSSKDKETIDILEELAIKALEQEPTEDAISREAVLNTLNKHWLNGTVASRIVDELGDSIKDLPPVIPQEPKTEHCKDCKYFEYDSVARVDGIPLIVVHEICSRWGDGCKTKEGGYCFLFEPQERSGEE